MILVLTMGTSDIGVIRKESELFIKRMLDLKTDETYSENCDWVQPEKDPGFQIIRNNSEGYDSEELKGQDVTD